MSVTESNIPCAPQYALSEVVDTYLIQRGVLNKKYYPQYLNSAYRAWKDVYQKVLFVTSAKWMPIKYGEPYDYIEVPRGIARFLSVNTVDKCGNIVSLYYNQQLNVIKEPEESTCSHGCKDCGCDGGMCEDANSTIMTETELFVISGVSYKEKKWVKTCKNGDVIEYTETPVKKYNDRRGNGGDYNSDYNNDYDIGTAGAFENMNVVYLTSQKIICKLKVRPCGCPEENEENAQLLSDFCGCYLNPCRKRKKCYPVFNDINPNGFGEVKISECGTKVYYKPPPPQYCHKEFKIPTHLQVSYQFSGSTVNEEIQVPDGIVPQLWMGVDYYSKIFNNKYSLYEKREARRMWEEAQLEIISYNNPLKLSFIAKVQDQVIKW